MKKERNRGKAAKCSPSFEALAILLHLLNINVTDCTLPNCAPLSGSLIVNGPCKFPSSSAGYTFTSLTINKEVLLEITSTSWLQNITVSGTLTISSEGGLVIEKVTSSGSSNGVVISGSGSGGSYAGRGGSPSSQQLTQTDSVIKGDVFRPDAPGSSGGGINMASAGKGGGALKLQANLCNINGNIRSNGDDATGSNAGGGSGGSIWVTCQHLNGRGRLEAIGGRGDGNGGGGSGGRISLDSSGGNFNGRTDAHGGKTGKS